jgi:hypothetical protein
MLKKLDTIVIYYISRNNTLINQKKGVTIVMNEEKNSLDEILQSHNNESSGLEDDPIDKLISLFNDLDNYVRAINNAVTQFKEKETFVDDNDKAVVNKFVNVIIDLIMNHVSFMLHSCQSLCLAIKEDNNDDTDD